MDRLELYMRETRPDQRREIAVLVQPPFQRAERTRHLLRRRGTKRALPGRLPPFQFCERRISPGCMFSRRTPATRMRCASHRRRLLSGSPLGSAIRERAWMSASRNQPFLCQPGNESIGFLSTPARRPERNPPGKTGRSPCRCTLITPREKIYFVDPERCMVKRSYVPGNGKIVERPAHRIGHPWKFRK